MHARRLRAPRVFIGSSSESLPIARGVKANLEHVAETRVWDEDIFRPSEYVMDELLQFTGSFYFAVFVFGPDDLVTSRREDFVAPRDNVLLEAGMFYASLGRRRTFALVDRSRSVKVPSDMLGMTIGTFLQPSDDNYKAATATACNSLATAITRIGLRDETTDETERALPSSPRAWPNVEAARDAMQESAQRSRKLRILTNGGFTYFGHDSSVIGTAAAPEYRDHLRRVMVLVLSPASRWVKDHFSSTRRAHQSTVAIARELEASQAILRSGLERFCRDAMVSGEMRYHTSEPYFRMLVTDQMAFVQTYAGAPGSQMRDQPVFAFDRREMGSLYGAFHRHFNDLWHNHASPTEAHIAGQQTITKQRCLYHSCCRR